jgi:WD40 repeat protein
MTNDTVDWLPERLEYRDDATGARMIRLTAAPCINHPLYYLTNSFTPDSKAIVFASNRTGQFDLYRADIETGAIRRLTNVADLAPFSGNVVGNDVYFTTADGTAWRLDLATEESRIVARCDGANLGEVTINVAGRLGCALVTKAGKAGLLVFQTDGSGSQAILEGVRALYHPQFHPTDPERLIYSADPPDPRLWTVRVDGTDDHCFYENRRDEWFVHETFLGRSDRVIVVCWHRGLHEVDLRSGGIRTIREFSAWHIASSSDGSRIVCDTHLPDIGLCLVDPSTGDYQVLCHPKATSQGSQWRKALPLQADDEAPGWATMTEKVTTESAYGPQWTHPHPSFSPDDRWVSFTSDASGTPQVYVVQVPGKPTGKGIPGAN